MNKIDKICKQTKVLVDSIKDLAEVNVVKALKESQVQISNEQINHLVKVVNSSIDDGYSRSYNSFRKSVESSVVEKTGKGR